MHAWFLCDKNITYSYLFYCCVIKDTCSNVNHWFSDSAGWPTTQNPPPGFQSTVHSTAQHPEPHKISEGNTHTVWLTCVQWYNFFFKFTYSGDMLIIPYMLFVSTFTSIINSPIFFLQLNTPLHPVPFRLQKNKKYIQMFFYKLNNNHTLANTKNYKKG